MSSKFAKFEKLLATVARDLGEVKADQFDNVLTICLGKLAQYIGFDRGTIMMFGEDEKQGLVATHCWARDGVPIPAQGFTIGEDMWYTHQVRSGHIVRILSVDDLPGEASKEQEFVAKAGVKAGISIPLMIQGHVVGALLVGSFHTERSWPMEMVARLRLVGEVIALGIRRHQDTNELAELARTADEKLANRNKRMRRLAFGLLHAENLERYRIGELLHEDVMQILALASMYIDDLARESDWSAADVQTLIQSVLKKLKDLALELRGKTLRKDGIVEGLHRLAQHMRHTWNLSIEVQVYDEVEPLPKDVRLFIYHAASELLKNVSVHSHSDHARLEIQRVHDQIRLCVSDDGVGFSLGALEPLPSKGFGLFSIREQAELLGGRMELSSTPGCGTRVTVIAPVSNGL